MNFHIIIGNNHLHWRTHIFQRGWNYTNQYIYMYWDLSYSATASNSVQFRLAMFSQWHIMTHTHARTHFWYSKFKGKNFRCSFRSDLYFVGTVSQMVYGCVSSCPCDYDRKLAAVWSFFLKTFPQNLDMNISTYFIYFHMDVGQNGRPRGPQMLV